MLAASAAVAAVLLASSGPASGDGSAATTRNCATGEPRLLVNAFIAAFNSGASARLDRIFAPVSSFKWYSTDAPGLRLGPAAYSRSTLIPYFAERHRARERLTLTSWTGGGNSNGYAHFQFELVRKARDLAPTPYQGKGALICSNTRNRIAVWSMGRK
jgi:hypothetical protein